MRLVQFLDGASRRRVGLVDGAALRVLDGAETIYEALHQAWSRGVSLERHVLGAVQPGHEVDYEEVAREGRLLLPIDHPDPYRMIITGTGLTHNGSAALRSGFHGEDAATGLTDSAKLFRAGLEGGKVPIGTVGVEPEWFHKGTGHVAVAHGGEVPAPAWGASIGEEAEIAGVYVVAPDGTPVRIGFTLANDVSDHAFEGRNYMYIAGSKLRSCPLGPELLVGDLPDSVHGRVRILRAGERLWEGEFRSGEAHMTHSIWNLEYHHFKADAARRPGDVHVHLFGCDETSGGAGLALEVGDEMEVDVPVFGRAQRTRVVAAPIKEVRVARQDVFVDGGSS
jgi:hypothetical protein